MPSLKGVTPALRVSDLDRSVRFYVERLGFEVRWRTASDEDGDACMLAAGGAAVLLSTGAHLGGTPRLTGTLYFDTDDVGGLWKVFEGTPDVLWPLEDTDHGTREFGVWDPDGYVLAFAEEIG